MTITKANSHRARIWLQPLIILAFALATGCDGGPDFSHAGASEAEPFLYFALDASASSLQEATAYREIMGLVMASGAAGHCHFALDSFANDREPIYTDSPVPYAESDAAVALLGDIQSIKVSPQRGTYFSPILRHAAELARQMPGKRIVLIILSDSGIDDFGASAIAARECSGISNLALVGIMPATNRENSFKKTEQLLSTLGARLVMGTDADYRIRLADLLKDAGVN